jgi:hypothetical protein
MESKVITCNDKYIRRKLAFRRGTGEGVCLHQAEDAIQEALPYYQPLDEYMGTYSLQFWNGNLHQLQRLLTCSYN